MPKAKKRANAHQFYLATTNQMPATNEEIAGLMLTIWQSRLITTALSPSEYLVSSRPE